ncbi:MAG: TonB-dependent receptor [Gammaproteobacteria bacterium]|jgi:outer membrane receptor protein involved in Fe transport
MKKTVKHVLCASVWGITAVSLAPPAHSEPLPAPQASSQSSPAPTDESQVLETVVVVAQKREQAAQDVPIALSVFSSAALDRAQIEDATDLQYSIPNAVLTGNDRYTLRGIGTNALGSSDLGVQSFVNGAAIGYLPQNELFDMERIEVLRGPQGTLYGRNTTGGAINVITRRPGRTVGGQASLQLGNFDNARFALSFDLPLGDKLATRFAAYKLMRDGYTDNLATGNQVDGRDQWAVRSTTVFEAGENTDFTLIFGMYDEDSTRAREGKRMCKAHPVLGCDPRQLGFDSPDANTTILNTLARFFTPFPAGTNIYAGAPNPTDLRKVAADTDPTYKLDQRFVTFDGNHRFGDLKLSGVVAWSEGSTEQNTDWDNADLPFRFTRPITYTAARGRTVTTDRLLTTDSFTSDTETRTAELRLASDYDGGRDFLIGAFYLEGKSSGGFETWHPSIESFQKANGRPEETWRVSALSRNGKNETKALFGELYFTLADDLRLTLGARQTEEKRSGESRSIVLAPLGPWVFSSFEGSKATGKAALDWTPDLGFTDQTLIYGSVSTGYKGGGLNNSNSAPTYGPEEVTAFEIGTKNTLRDGRLQANFAGFLYDYSGLQLGQRINGGVVTRNADADIWGLEAEFLYAPSAGWLIDANLSYLDTEIGTFFSEDAANPAQSLTATTPTVQVNLAGNELPHSPSAKAKVGVQFTTTPSAGGWTSTWRLDALWQDKYFAREYNTPTDVIESWGTFDLQARFDRADQGVSVRFFVKNVSDEDNITNIIIEDALIGRYRNVRLLEPRTFGVIFEKAF